MAVGDPLVKQQQLKLIFFKWPCSLNVQLWDVILLAVCVFLKEPSSLLNIIYLYSIQFVAFSSFWTCFVQVHVNGRHYQ